MMRRGIVSLFLVLTAASCSCEETQATDLTAELAVQPALLEFGQVTVDTSRELTFRASNTGTSTLVIDAASSEEAFVVSPARLSIVSGSSGTFTVTFTPTATAPSTGTIHLASNGGEATVELTGEGIAGAVRVDPRAGFDFGDVARDRRDTNKDDRTKPVTRTIGVINGGSDTVEILSVGIATGEDAFSGDFSGLLGTYGSAERREAHVIFDPAVLGSLEGALRITTSSVATPEILVPLKGRGIAPVLVACWKLQDEPADAARCTTELPVPGAGVPSWEFGAFDDLEGRRGELVIRNEGNVPLEIRSILYQPASPDIRFFDDAAMESAIDIDAYQAVICPADLDDPACSVEGEIKLWVDYRARGSYCCNEGVPECVALAPDGDCTRAANTDQGQLTIITNDRIGSPFAIVGRGRSLIAVAQIDTVYSADHFMNDQLVLAVKNAGDVTLEVTGLMLSDPVEEDCAGGPPCDCSESGDSIPCQVFRIDPALVLPIVVEPGERTEVVIDYLDPNMRPHLLRLWWDTTDPIAPRHFTRIAVAGQGLQPD